jgi:PAS domain S-box-containing protein
LTDLFGTIPGSLDKLFRKLIEEGYRIEDGEGVEKLPDGTERFYFNNGYGVIVKGKLLRVWGTFRDITERKQAEETLRKSEEMWRSLAENAPNNISIIDRDGTITYINRTVPGITKDEVIGKKVYDFVMPEYHNVLRDSMEYVFDNGESTSYESRALGPDNSISTYDVQVGPIKHDGQVVAVTLISTDITERKQAMEALQQERDKAHNYLDIAGVMIVAIDSNQEIILINKKGCEILGYNLNEIIGKNWFDNFLAKQDRNSVKEVFDKLMLGEIEPVEYYENSVLTKKGQERVIAWHNTFLTDRTGNITCTLSSGEDITERKQADEALIKAKKEIELWNRELEKRVKEKTEDLVKSQAQLIQSEKLSAMGQMAGGLAHELNSPLGGLLPMIEKFKNETKEGTKEYNELSLMLNACEYMAKIVRDFGTFSREAKGEFFELNLSEVIEDTLSFSASRIKQKGIHIIKEYKDYLPNVLGEKTELQQVILNMITNASDAMTDRGELRIKTDITKDKNNVIMEFIDNGAGIEKKYLGKIFDPFYTTKRPGRGTGLGLSVSYKIIEKHGGKIYIESEPGKGTKFTIYMPAVKSNNA